MSDASAAPPPAAGPAAACLVVDDVSYEYEDRPVLRGVSLTVNAGELVCLLGPNGAGKSTLIKTVSGELEARTGRIAFAGGASSLERARAIGIVPQSVALFRRLSVLENLLAFGALMGLEGRALRARANEVLETIDLLAHRKKTVESLSGGMRRRLNVGAALMHEPELLLLDEPTAGVDKAGRERLGELFARLCERGLGVVLVTHELDDAEAMASKVAILVEGRMLAVGAVDTLMAQAFGDRRLVCLEFDEPVTAGAAAPLEAFGQRSPTSCEALLALSPGELDRLLEDCRAAGLSLREVRVIRPRLTQLIDHYTTGGEA